MPPKNDREYVTWNIIDLLTAGMVAKLAAIKAEKDPQDTARFSRTILLPDFDVYYYGNRTGYPKSEEQVIFVAPTRTQPRADEGNFREDVMHFDLVIVLSSEEDVDFSETDLNLKIDRYYRAVSELLFADRGLLSTVSDSKEISSDVHDLEQKGDWLFQSADIRVEAWNVFTG